MDDESKNADDSKSIDALFNRIDKAIRSSNPKVPVRETMPAPFARFMKEVTALIADSDESTTTESDDLLQTPFCYGGLSETGEFFFCLYPGDEDDETKWQFSLTSAQIDAIAKGAMTTLDLWMCERCRSSDRYGQIEGYCRPCDASLLEALE